MKKLLSLVAVLALLGAACGGSGDGPDPAEDPKGALVSSFEGLQGGSHTIVFTIQSTPESLNALASDSGGSGMTPEDAQKILDSSLTVSAEGEGEDAKAQVLVNVAGSEGAVEMRVIGKDFYLRADVMGLMEQFGADTSMLDGVAAQAEAQGLTFVRPALDGEWLGIKGLQDSLGQLTGGAATPTMDQQKIIDDITAAIQSKATVTSEGDDDVGTHLKVNLPIRDLYTELSGSFQSLTGSIPGAQLPDPSEIPDEDVVVDVWVDGSDLKQVEVDFLQFAALAGETVPDGVDQLAFRIAFADFSGDTSVPEGAVEVDPSVIFQSLLGGLGGMPGSTGGTAVPGGDTGFDCSQLEGAPKDVKKQFQDLCPGI
ncbi:MAG: hypothetical protein QOG54_963 [Actinomycetota bacterium]|jgi:hypothetical protein|nr:hypothetical protein [Actinomycetota bacterium]